MRTKTVEMFADLQNEDDSGKSRRFSITSITGGRMPVRIEKREFRLFWGELPPLFCHGRSRCGGGGKLVSPQALTVERNRLFASTISPIKKLVAPVPLTARALIEQAEPLVFALVRSRY
ncbi:hypothetical protein [Geobacillus sp. YF-1]|uniref:hypothetical protein n=1 Tax=Geobacillus sp. YF-1 TaxID=3457480 RepID=UPI0040463A8D